MDIAKFDGAQFLFADLVADRSLSQVKSQTSEVLNDLFDFEPLWLLFGHVTRPKSRDASSLEMYKNIQVCAI